MQNHQIDILPYDEKYKHQVLVLWEKSVLATHHFLSPADFISIKEIVHSIDFKNFEVYCLVQSQRVIGFMGVADKKVEMLFIDPDHLGQGLGTKLMGFALTGLQANAVDVNEQNFNAWKFYKKLGFETYERTEKDDQGKNYPLLRMKLKSQNI